MQDCSPEEEPLLYQSACKLFWQLLPISFFLPCSSSLCSQVLKDFQILPTLEINFTWKNLSVMIEENLMVVLFIPCIHLHGLTIETKHLKLWSFSNLCCQ